MSIDARNRKTLGPAFFLVSLCILVPACGGAYAGTESETGAAPLPPAFAEPPRSPVPESEEARAMDDAWGRLGAELQSQGGVDCFLIADLADTICSLSEKLCELSAEEPDNRELQDRCEDGRNRCQRASQERDERCPEREGSVLPSGA